MKVKLVFLVIFWPAALLSQAIGPANELASYLADARKVAYEKSSLWDTDLYGPVLFIEPDTRKLYANEQIVNNALMASGSGLYHGTLPDSVNIANTALKWGGKHWAMIMIPLPQNRSERLNLIMHELFHRAQEKLHFPLSNSDNNHLDKKDGRTYLRLELEALRLALAAKSINDARKHISNALGFRLNRHQLYSGADSTENILEINEGLAEYTGLMMSGRNHQEIVLHLDKSLNEFQKNKTFVRSFAYQTIPVYGFLTSLYSDRSWNKKIDSKTNLTGYFLRAFGFDDPALLVKQSNSRSSAYGYQRISGEETSRDEANRKITEDLVTKFIRAPHFDIPFEMMSVSFDPGNLIPLDGHGTVYPNLRVTDNWGILTVNNGALMSTGWDKITVTMPLVIRMDRLEGDGWTLELNSDQYIVIRDELTNHLKLARK